MFLFNFVASECAGQCSRRLKEEAPNATYYLKF